jgi:ATP-dependent Zn protease
METTTSIEEPTSRDGAIETSVGRLVDDARSVVAATTVLEGAVPENRRRYEDQVCRALTNMEIDLGIARAALEAHDATTSDDLQDTMREIDESARQWLEDLALRARLGEMEINDRTGDVEHRLDRARGEVRRATRRIDDAVESDLDAMRTLALHALRDIRDAVGDSVDAILHYIP